MGQDLSPNKSSGSPLADFASYAFWLGMFTLAFRAILRVWVDSQRDEWVIAFPADQLQILGVTLLSFGIILALLAAFTNRVKTVDFSLVRISFRFLSAGVFGMLASGFCQAWLHVSKLAILGGWPHPRSITVASFIAFGLAVLFFVTAFTKRHSSRY